MPKPFLTPPSTPIERQCRTLRMPSSLYWLGVFNSALLEMLNVYNWEQVNDTDLTIDEAIAICEEVLAEFFLGSDCTEEGACLQPDGSRVLRFDANWHIQQLTDGVWTEPTGDYEVPPVPSRPEPTPSERRCLAAANAANVLKQTYEIVTDGVNEGLTNAEIAAAVAAYILATVGAWLALAFIAFLGLVAALFIAFIEIAQFMTIDLWDAEFDELLVCLLYECSSDDGSVVTFDLNCFNENYAATVDLSDADALDQLRLYGQVWFMLSVIGADGLNAAGATTAIETADCSSCADEWCHTFDFTIDDGDWIHIDTGTGNWVSGQGWVGVLDGLTYRVRIKRAFPTAGTFTRMEMTYDLVYGSGVPLGSAHLKNDGTYVAATVGFPAGTDQVVAWDGSLVANNGTIELRAGSTGSNGSVTVKRLTYYGTGDNPFGEDNCP